MEKQILLGKNTDVLKRFPDNYFDSIVTDSPYGLGKEPKPEEVLRGWLENDHHDISGKGFMSKEWDAFVPSPLIWKEAYRVLKPGGHVVSFFGTRTYDWGVMAMRLAGFEVRDCLTWAYATGFPKSHDISKAIDEAQGIERPKEIISTGDISNARYVGKDASPRVLKEVSTKDPISELSKKWEGFGTALKPATEPIVLARKPIEKGLTIAENVLKWGTGALNIDGCRIETEDNLNGGAYSGNPRGEGIWKENSGFKNDSLNEFVQPEGRWPANLMLSHDPECTSNKCQEGCPIKVLDDQSGILRTGESKDTYMAKASDNNHMQGKNYERPMMNRKGSVGGASRFFYCAKASKREKNKGCENITPKKLDHGREHGQAGTDNAYNRGATEKNNSHPTVKPIKVMRWLVNLITPPGGTTLDLFAGSGTTGIACELDGFGYVLIDNEEDYIEIIKARIAAWAENPSLEEPEADEIEIEDLKPLRVKETQQLSFF